MAKQPAGPAEVPVEPTNDDIKNGAWQQPPPPSPQQVVVNVPDGVFAKLAQARERYEELTPKQFRAYGAVADFQISSKEFAVKGDMSSETATALAAATASKVFDEITAYVPKPRHVGICEAAVIGTIDTANDGHRYFRVNAPTKGKWTTKEIVSVSHATAFQEWWVEYWMILLIALVAIAWPVVLGVITANPVWLLFYIAEFVILGSWLEYNYNSNSEY